MPAKLISFHALGRNTGTPRIWLENQRLAHLGFTPGRRVAIRGLASNRLSVEPAPTGLKICSRGKIPIIDICSLTRLSALATFEQIKVIGTPGRLVITPSIQGFYIARSRTPRATFRVLELCAGGGTLHTAIASHPEFTVVGAAEFNQAFANEYGKKAPEADLIIGDIRRINPREYPDHDVVVAGFPCTDMSCLGRVKKRLGGRPEDGKQSDVFLPILAVVAARMPRAVVLENVPQIASSHTAMIIRRFFATLGYHVSEHVLNAHAGFGDIQRRSRWCLIATLNPGFRLRIPDTPSKETAGAYLDAPDDTRDREDAARIAATIAGLDKRREAHRARGNDFRYYTINGDSREVPTLTKSMHKINQGPFVETSAGLRMPRKAELERIAGHTVESSSYPLTCQILGQGVSVRMFSEIFRQLGAFLRGQEAAVDRFGQLSLFDD